ncbi:uncharacterized protein LACBIDRAFT_328502 [Laccaria bicolor S238N-H82]|uniref:Predicted protein n=1 Tax=Laccaria bicolor (strain S238N-H82 / ATCC MYA-4686) TaxID=486041 RepID=B0DF18_LACBS|nr:uncharacterized protein LACBIDRAFT_328502 [Laccaria bicolor S238N-H82]EDR06771.1 predicted protein [Laccaria bicolor S238N-H82]|eukprot:XP_001882618.1 predicted protein [Laccaria bicolor S238N-H82]
MMVSASVRWKSDGSPADVQQTQNSGQSNHFLLLSSLSGLSLDFAWTCSGIQSCPTDSDGLPTDCPLSPSEMAGSDETRIPAAFESNGSVSSIPTIARSPAAFEGNTSATSNNGSWPLIIQTTSKNQSLPTNTSYAQGSCTKNCQCPDFESRNSLSQTSPQWCEDKPINDLSSQTTLESSLAQNLAAFEGDSTSQVIDSSSSLTTLCEDEAINDQTTQVILMPSIARIIAASEGNDSATTDVDSTPSPSTLAHMSTALEDNNLATIGIDSTSSVPTIAQSSAAFEGNHLAMTDNGFTPSTTLTTSKRPLPTEW